MTGISPLEIAWREFRAQMDVELGITQPPSQELEELPTPKTLQRRSLRNGRFSKPPKPKINPNPIPRPGEIPLKQFLTEEAVRLNTNPKTIYSRWYYGKYNHLQIRRVNKRIVFVTVTTC